MNRLVTRRSFVKLAAGLVAFIPALKYLVVDRVRADVTVPEIDVTKFRSGRVSSIQEGRLIAEDGSVITLDSTTSIWKKSWSDPLAAELGDDFVAWGQPNADGTFAPEKIYFNIFTVYGKVSELTMADQAATFDLIGGREGASISAFRETLVASSDSEATFDPSSPAFNEGDTIQVVGIRTTDGLVATRILI